MEFLLELNEAVGGLVFLVAFGIFQELAAVAGMAGKKPEVPKFKPINLADEQSEAIDANIKALPKMADLAAGIDRKMMDQREKTLERSLPGYADLRDNITSYINDMMSGVLPKDVERYIQRKGAEWAQGSGVGYKSGMKQNYSLRDAMITSMQRADAGLNAGQRWLQFANQTTLNYDFTGMMISPALQLQTAQYNQGFQFNRDWMANKISAAPSPTQQAFYEGAKAFDQMIYDIIGNVAGMAIGGGGGGMGGGAKPPMGGGGGGGMYSTGGSMPLTYDNPNTAAYVGGVKSGIIKNPWE